MDWMPKRAARAGLWSTLTLATFTRPDCSVAISSSTGASILQGPHHSAQKSTSTGWVDFSTSASKFAPLISMVGFIFLNFHFVCNIYRYIFTQKKRSSTGFFMSAIDRSLDRSDHPGQSGLLQVPFQSILRRRKNLVQSLPDAMAHRARRVGFSRRRGKRFNRFDRPINFSQIDAPWRTTQTGTGPGPFAGLHQPGPLQSQQQPPDNDGVGIDAARQQS